MTHTINPPTHFLGCDVGKAEIVIFDSRDQSFLTVANNRANLRKCLHDLQAVGDSQVLVICEATGGYEADLVQLCLALDVPVHRADARKVKAFIRSFGTLGKTDAIDARMLAQYGQERHASLPLSQPRSDHAETLQILVLLRVDLVEQKKACANRLNAPTAGAAAPFLKKKLRFLLKQIEAVEIEIKKLVDSQPNLAKPVQLLTDVKGIGSTTAISLIALMPELGALSRRQAAELAGLAPHPRQSGNNNAYRRTKGGRPEVKRCLFMAALVAVRYNKTIASFYQRLKAAGKKPIVALVAAMRKLLCICNAILRQMFAEPKNTEIAI